MVAEYREKYDALLKRSQEDVTTLKSLRAKVLSADARGSKLERTLEEEKENVARRDDVIGAALDSYAQLLSLAASSLKLDMEPVQRSLLEPLRVAQTATWKSDWVSHVKELNTELLQRMQDMANEAQAVPGQIASMKQCFEEEVHFNCSNYPTCLCLNPWLFL